MIPTWTASKKKPRIMSSLVLRCQILALTPLKALRGVWLEMGDNMGHFMDMKLLSFSSHPSLLLTLYPPPTHVLTSYNKVMGSDRLYIKEIITVLMEHPENIFQNYHLHLVCLEDVLLLAAVLLVDDLVGFLWSSHSFLFKTLVLLWHKHRIPLFE